MTDIERVTQQIKDEIRVDQQGRSFISIRGSARLADVADSSLRRAFEGAAQKPSGLAEFLIQNGFEGAAQNEWRESGIPDLALALILEYYGYEAQERYRREQAKAACRVFRAIGIRVWMQQIKGYFQSTPHSSLPTPLSPEKAKLPDGLLNLVDRIEKRGEELHTAHHRLMSDVRELVELIRTTYNQDARVEFCDLLRLAADQIEKAVAVPRLPEMIEQAFIMNSTQTGCLERYTSKKKNKAGVVIEYPKINALTRDESIDEDWNWRYKYAIKEEVAGKWKNKSKSVPLDKLPSVRAAIALDATLLTILRLIEG